MRGHKVALSGSYLGGNANQLFNSLSNEGIFEFSLIGREITLQVKSEHLEDVKKTLGRLGVENINILEWKKCGMTIAGSGSSHDDGEIVRISLIPTAFDEGIKPLAFLCDFFVSEKTQMKIQSEVENVLENAGITDAVYTVHLKRKTDDDSCMRAAKIATLNAIFEAGGIVSIE